MDPRTFIRTSTPIEEAFQHLLDHGCVDITPKLDLPRCSRSALSGGTFGDVWYGVLRDQTRVAIKCLRLHAGMETMVKHTKRSARELFNWSKLKHPNVLELLGIALFKDHLAMLSPWMENGTLTSYLSANPEADTWTLCFQIAEGLAYIHQQGMIHGDLKPLNILVSQDIVIKITDFGGSVLLNSSLGFSGSDHGGGTIRYRAPELLVTDIAECSTNDGMAADVYSLGMTILEALTGNSPYSNYQQDWRVGTAVTSGELPRRSTNTFPYTKLGEERWQMLLECWKMVPIYRPTSAMVASQMMNISHPSAFCRAMNCITDTTDASEVLRKLADHGCQEITHLLDLSQFSTLPVVMGHSCNVKRGTFKSGTHVAIKYQRYTSGTDELMYTARELGRWSQARHENVLELIGPAIIGGQLAMVSLWMDHGTLSVYIDGNPGGDRWALCLQVAKGLAYMHGINMVHGNLKGANIYVSDEGVVKLGYFCHAISEYYLGFSSPSSDVNEWTPRWMAPELLAEREEGSADRSMPADVYALGMTIMEVVTGKVPYPEMRSDAGVIMRVIQGKYPQRPVEISSSTRHGDARWEMLLSCWKTKANSRPTAREVRDTIVRLS